MSRLSQQNTLILLPLVGAVILASLLGLFLAGRKRISKPAARVARHHVRTPAGDVQKYWTAEKMHSAKPAPMPHLTDAGEGKQQQKSQNPQQPQA